jgi:hypothetical protein
MVRKEATARAGSGRREGTEMGRERKRRLEEQTEGLRKTMEWKIADKGSKIGGKENERLKEKFGRFEERFEEKESQGGV